MSIKYNIERRSPRSLEDIGIIVRGVSMARQNFIEQTFTISISAHGALLLLETQVEIGQTLFLKNPLTNNEVESKVVRFGPPRGGLAVVGVEFKERSEEFWKF